MINIQGGALSERTARAAIWAVSGKLFGKLIDFVSLLILARILGPSEFGLVAMAMTAVFIVEAILELPLATALIRVPEPTDEMFETAFTLGLIRGVLVAATLGGASWGMSLFYGEPRLVGLICLLSIAPIMRGLISPRMVIFVKRFDFRRDFALDISGKLCAFILAVLVAVKTESYWAIAIGTITTPTVMMLLSQIIAPQSFKLRLSEWPVFADIVGWNTLSQFIMAINWQADKIFLGRYVEPLTLGRYSTASDLAAIPYQAIVQPLSKPLIAAFSALRSDHARGAAYGKVSAILVMLVSPLLICMSMFSELFVRLLLGGKWTQSAPILHWLSLVATIGVMAIPANSLAMVMNKTRFITVRTGVEAFIKLPLMMVLASSVGVKGVIVAQAVVTFVCVIFAMWSVSKIISAPMVGQLLAVLRPQIALFILFILVRPFSAPHVDGVGAWFVVIAAVLGCYVLYFFIIVIVWILCGFPEGVERYVFDKFVKF